MEQTAYIGIGSNSGLKLENCKASIAEIEKIHETKVAAVSSWYKTRALTIGDEAQPDFINGVTKILTGLEPKKLLNELKKIEVAMGRRLDDKKWSPRSIDLDILFFGNLVLDDFTLKIPHPEIEKRTFVLTPLCDIAPELVHPRLGVRAKDLLKRLKSSEDICFKL